MEGSWFARPSSPQPPGLVAALVPVATLVGLLGLSFVLFGDAAAAGPNQIALVFCAIVASFVAWRRGHSVADLRDAGMASVSTGLTAIFILLAVGALIGTWAMSGTLVAMVYYGLQLLNPHYFYMTACLICAVVAVSIGSSWTVAGTIGIGLMGIAQKMGLDPAITAGAVISGAYFGDKSSPLSDTANLACAASGADLYDHIRELLWTSVPALLLALAAFWSLGSPIEFDPGPTLARIEAGFHPRLLHFLPLILVLGLALLRWPPFVTIFLGALAGGVLAVATAPERVIAFAGGEGLPAGLALLKGVWAALATGFVSTRPGSRRRCRTRTWSRPSARRSPAAPSWRRLSQNLDAAAPRRPADLEGVVAAADAGERPGGGDLVRFCGFMAKTMPDHGGRAGWRRERFAVARHVLLAHGHITRLKAAHTGGAAIYAWGSQ